MGVDSADKRGGGDSDKGGGDTYHIRVHVLLQVGTTQLPVPVVSDVTAIHDLPE